MKKGGYDCRKLRGKKIHQIKKPKKCNTSCDRYNLVTKNTQ